MKQSYYLYKSGRLQRKDNTLEICHEHNFNVVNLPVNMGIGGGVQTGYMYAYRNGYDIAVQFDGDGQHNASFRSKS